MTATILETRTHVKGDRDFLFDWLRALSRAIRRVQQFPGDEAAARALQLEFLALHAFGEEDNIQAGATRRASANSV